MTVVAGNLQLLGSSTINGSLVATAGNIDLAAKIGSDATIVASNLRDSAQIKGDLQGSFGQMHLTSKAVIGGNLEYSF